MTEQEIHEKAGQAINGFMGEMDGDEGYSCDQCRLDMYFCPHLQERLRRHIVEVFKDA